MIISRTGGGDFAPAREGVHVAICTRVIDLGTQTSTYKGEDKRAKKVLIGWELPDEPLIEINGEQLPPMIMGRYTASLHEKAQLFALLVSWRGRKFTDDELKAFDLKNVLGAPCYLQVIHSDDGKFANVKTLMPLPKGVAKPTATGPLIHLSLAPDEFDPKAYEALTPKMKAIIADAPEYLVATGRAPAQGAAGPVETAHDYDDEIPF